jgi:hypothetical protein
MTRADRVATLDEAKAQFQKELGRLEGVVGVEGGALTHSVRPRGQRAVISVAQNLLGLKSSENLSHSSLRWDSYPLWPRSRQWNCTSIHHRALHRLWV